jgi:hypothetical protein
LSSRIIDIFYSLPYTNRYGDIPVISFTVVLLAHNASVNFKYWFLWFLSMYFFNICTSVLFVDLARPLPCG